MTEFEKMINNGKLESKQICCILTKPNSDERFEAWINANSIQEIDRKLPEGYELMTDETLQNYFDHKVIAEYEIELVNSQYIYYTDFDKLVEYGLMQYVVALKDENYQRTERMDRQASDKYFADMDKKKALEGK